MLRVLAAIGGLALLLPVLTDAFDTIVLARRARRIFRVTRYFYSATWAAFASVGKRIESGRRRETFLGVYGPLSLLSLLALWAVCVIVSFALLQWAAGLKVKGEGGGFGEAFYVAAGALFTMTVEDPVNRTSRFLLVLEGGLGFSLLGLVVGYLPVLYQSFANREQRISLLDARAGSPPSAAVLILRQGSNPEKLEEQLVSWEAWASDVLETQLSYPMLAYFRSQHENQSWLGAIVAILDASAIVQLGADGDLRHQAELTFAMGRHTLADLVTVFRLGPPKDPPDRLPTRDFHCLADMVERAEAAVDFRRISEGRLRELREMYEPFAVSLSTRFLMAIPGWLPAPGERDNWQRTSWDSQGSGYTVSDPFAKRNG